VEPLAVAFYCPPSVVVAVFIWQLAGVWIGATKPPSRTATHPFSQRTTQSPTFAA